LSYVLQFDLNKYKNPYEFAELPPPPSTIDADEYTIIPLWVRNVPFFSIPPLVFTITWGNTPNNYRVRVWWAGSPGMAYDPIWGTNP
jgi:hypothetical protein